jgi:peptide deformylase
MTKLMPVLTLNKATLWLKNIALRQKCIPVNLTEPEELEKAQLVIKEMLKCLYSDPSGVAIASSQIGVLMPIIAIDYKDSESGKQELHVFINPVIDDYSEEKIESNEMCLSVPGFSGKVIRSKTIKINGYDQLGNPQTVFAEGFLSTVFQHEIDHINGILYIDKLESELNPVPDYAERRMKSTIKLLSM